MVRTEGDSCTFVAAVGAPARLYSIRMYQDAASILLAAAVGLLLVGLVRRAAPIWLAVAILVLPALVLLGDFQRQQISAHGLLHASIVYSIHERGLPAEHPLLAGQPLRYPYLHHWLVAIVAAVLDVPPGTVFGFSGLLSLLILCVACDYGAKQLDADRGFRILVIILAATGSAILSRGPLAELAARANLLSDGRLLPWLKFTGVNSNHLGLACAAVALAALLRSERNLRASLGVLAAATLGAGLLYPVSLLAIFSWTACFAAAEIWRHGAAGRGRALALAGSAGAGLLVSLPYLLSVAAGRGAAGAMLVPPNLDYVLRHGAILATTLAVPAVILWTGRRELFGLFERHPRNGLALAGSACATFAWYLFGFISPLTAYKNPLAGFLPTALLLAWPLRSLCRRRPLTAGFTLALFALPWAAYCLDSWLRPWPVSERVARQGMNLVPLDPGEVQLQAFLAEATPARAVIVDSRASAAPFAHRALLVAPADLEVRGMRDGWGMSADTILGAVTGADHETVNRRRAMVAALLALQGPAPEPALLATLRREAGTDVYVVVREAEARERLAGKAGLRPVFSSPTAAVLRLE